MSETLIPPWHRSVQTAETQTLFGDGAINLNVDTTYLDSTTPKDESDLTVPYDLTIANGNHKRQVKRIFIPAQSAADTARWKLTGTLVNGAALLFHSIATSAVLEWVGDGWSLIGGNADVEH